MFKFVNDLVFFDHIVSKGKSACFAIGAVLAAEWLMGKKGFFEMKDMFKIGSELK